MSDESKSGSNSPIERGPKGKLRPLQEELTDLPNLITLARIALIPLILLCIDNYSPRLSALSALLFAFAAATDFVDGYLARRLGLVTVVGKFLDPLADKLIVLSTLVFLVAQNRAPAWLVIILMSRELAITGLRAIASQEGFVISAGATGKFKTAFQLAGITFLLVHFRYRILFTSEELDFHEVGIGLLYVSLAMSVWSAAEYFRFFARAASRQAEELAAQGITRAALREKARERRAENRKVRAQRRRSKRERRREKMAARRQRRQARRSRRRRRRPGDRS